MIISALRYLNDRTDLISLCYLARHYREDILGCPVTDWTDITSRLGQDSEMLKELLPEAFVQQREALSHYPLYELIEQLVSLLLFAPGSSQRPLTDDAYLFAFLDETIAYLSDQSSSLDEFLEYWDNTLSLKSIPSSDQSRGIQVVSIHKSKGLQYKTVFLPCCDWDLEKTAPTICFGVHLRPTPTMIFPTFPLPLRPWLPTPSTTLTIRRSTSNGVSTTSICFT